MYRFWNTFFANSAEFQNQFREKLSILSHFDGMNFNGFYPFRETDQNIKWMRHIHTEIRCMLVETHHKAGLEIIFTF